MVEPQEVAIEPLDPERLDPLLDADQRARFDGEIADARRLFAGRSVWNVNSTARGGGVAELLRSLVAYIRGAGVDAGWLVIGGTPEFFRITKRIHNLLHGSPGDGGTLGEDERRVYMEVLAENAEQLAARVRGEDLVILHDPQTAGLIPALHRRGILVVWRCHVGVDEPGPLARHAWSFLTPYVREADRCVFSRPSFAWEGLEPRRLAFIPPAIDPFSLKNRDLGKDEIAAILRVAGLDGRADGGQAEYTRPDGTVGFVRRPIAFVEENPVPTGAPLVVQVSRWDRLKDPLGVVLGFARRVAGRSDAHLVLAGPDVRAVADDPEGAAVFAEVEQAWRHLPPEERARVHLASLPMADGDENAVLVNALQRHADVVVQKSLAEGFGLTVAEAMWKGRPVVASGLGGIQDQIEHGVSGILLHDPTDLDAYGDAVAELIRDPRRAARMGVAARERVRGRYLHSSTLMAYGGLLRGLLGETAPQPPPVERPPEPV